MTSFIWVRPLSDAEEEYLKKNDVWPQLAALRPLSIMGREDSYFLKHANVEVWSRRVDLGGGQYIYESSSGPTPTGGQKVPVVWSIDSSMNLVADAARASGIPFVTHPSDYNVLYFQTRFSNAFLQAFRCADMELHNWYNRRSVLVRWFGPMQPDWDSEDSKAYRERVRKAFAANLR